jgi:putative transposase
MARKRLSAEQIVTKLRQIEVLQGQGKTIAMACREAGTTEQTQGRMSQWGNLLQSQGSPSGYREMAYPPQYKTSTLSTWLPTTCTRHHHTKTNPSRRGVTHAIITHCVWYKISGRSGPTSDYQEVLQFRL